MRMRARWPVGVRVLAAAGCVLWLAVAAVARQSGTADDPVTGKWGMDGLTFLDLKFDGKKTVTGSTV